METFKHKFFGWLEADAHRHVNSDGSIGGIVAVSAIIAVGVNVPESVQIGPRASIGSDVSIGSFVSIGGGVSIADGASIAPRASIAEGDWFITCGPQGSRNAMLTAVQTIDGLRWWVGCKYNVTTDALRKMIAETHGEGDHFDDYSHVIEFVENHPARIRCEAARAQQEADHG